MKVKKDSRIFYAPNLKSEMGEWGMTTEESHHLIKVLRHQQGDEIHVVNGKGLMLKALITEANKRNCVIEIESIIEERAKESELAIAIAPTKSIDRFEWFLEKATELGVGSIHPFISEHSERKVIKNERLDKIIVSAMKQSGRLWKPHLAPLKSIEEILNANIATNKYIAHCHESLKSVEINKGNKSNVVMVGPEGGFSSTEVNKALENGFQGLDLGEYRLRSETAGIVVCQVFGQK